MSARSRPAFVLAVACAALLCTGQSLAASRSARPFAENYALTGTERLQDDPDGLSLRPGEFVWLAGAGEYDRGAPVTMLVSLRDQRGYLYRDGRRIAVTTVSTGTPGRDTPTGVFPIIEKKPIHYSKKYENAPMPWMQRLTGWGHALHAGHVRAGPASHGCIRLPAEFARQLYSLTRAGDLVVVSQDTSASSIARAGLFSRSPVMMAGAPVAPERIAEAMQALGEPAPEAMAEVGSAGATAF